MEITWKIIESTLGIAFIIIGYLMKTKIEKIEKEIEKKGDKIESLEKDMSEFKDNYLSRFERVNESVNNSKLEIIDKIHQLELSIRK